MDCHDSKVLFCLYMIPPQPHRRLHSLQATPVVRSQNSGRGDVQSRQKGQNTQEDTLLPQKKLKKTKKTVETLVRLLWRAADAGIKPIHLPRVQSEEFWRRSQGNWRPRFFFLTLGSIKQSNTQESNWFWPPKKLKAKFEEGWQGSEPGLGKMMSQGHSFAHKDRKKEWDWQFFWWHEYLHFCVYCCVYCWG